MHHRLERKYKRLMAFIMIETRLLPQVTVVAKCPIIKEIDEFVTPTKQNSIRRMHTS